MQLFTIDVYRNQLWIFSNLRMERQHCFYWMSHPYLLVWRMQMAILLKLFPETTPYLAEKARSVRLLVQGFAWYCGFLLELGIYIHVELRDAGTCTLCRFQNLAFHFIDRCVLNQTMIKIILCSRNLMQNGQFAELHVNTIINESLVISVMVAVTRGKS